MVAIQTATPVGAPTAGTWQVDPSHSSVAFSVRHLMITNVRGRFAKFSGTVHVGDTPEASSVEVAIDAASIDTGHEERDAHLRSADFLDVERYPTVGFRSTRVEQVGEDRLRVTGDFTIRDVTRQVVLDVRYEGAANDPWGNSRAAFSASAEIDREDFGVTWNQALETGGFLVGKTIKVEIEVEAVRAADAQAA